MAGWMINCKEYATLLSRSQDKSMSFWEKVSMKIHQILCPLCNQIRFQFETIRKACQLTPEGETSPEAGGRRLPEEICEQMKDVLRKAAKEKDT